ncbi:SCF ubiquitin ligase complex subunit [Saxophila tyrrhenica]|uniref:SCF ubiquitin ligase complex subunit n=1 Tax=Saxophila tyrrhenica TaxID=1690608 RepID=A0AAV9PJI2_9PEZI|nr:SCF ubiquitin ligase complex subunit [Saxophila tyrrhenica]
MSRSRPMQRTSSASNSSSSSTSPERGADDDNDSFMLQANDSQSSLGMDMSPDMSDEYARREYEERCRVSPVHRLPAELLISIFSRLTANSDLQSCLLVSKEWARNSVGLLWHRPAMSRWESIHNVVQSIRKADKFFAYQDLVKRLNMSTLANSVSDGTLVGMTACKRVERLTLTNCTKLTDLALQPLVDGNRSLLALDVTGLDQLTDRTMMTVADHCLRLQGLNVTGCKKLTDASIAAVAKNCRHLKRLKFNNCIQLTDASILTVADHSTHLLEIDLYGLQNLESPAITALLTSCTHLREMRLAHCSRINDSAFTDIPSSPGHQKMFESLRILDLTDCNELGDRGVEKIIQTCPRLRNLILAKCRQITDRAVFAITKLGKNLHYIHLGHCARITDLSVEALAKACNRIRYIDLACCVNLTDNSVTKLAGLPKLKRIGLVKCSTITDRSIYALAMGEVKNGRRINGVSVLERVHLSYCTLLTLDGIHVLLNNCPKLTHLSLTGVQAFLRDELLAFCREAPPEFNDHQRDVFCVFSGTGVGRLREFLNQQKAHAAAAAAEREAEGEGSLGGNSETGSEMGDAEDGDAVHVNVHGNHAAGATPVVFAPGWQHHGGHHGHQHHNSFDNAAGAAVAGSSVLSQSAPASTPMFWSNAPAGLGLAGFAGLAGFGSAAGSPAGGGGGGGGAQQVTGMMGAAVLDDVDEGDEAFGEGSEIMGDGD